MVSRVKFVDDVSRMIQWHALQGSIKSNTNTFHSFQLLSILLDHIKIDSHSTYGKYSNTNESSKTFLKTINLNKRLCSLCMNNERIKLKRFFADIQQWTRMRECGFFEMCGTTTTVCRAWDRICVFYVVFYLPFATKFSSCWSVK